MGVRAEAVVWMLTGSAAEEERMGLEVGEGAAVVTRMSREERARALVGRGCSHLLLGSGACRTRESLSLLNC